MQHHHHQHHHPQQQQQHQQQQHQQNPEQKQQYLQDINNYLSPSTTVKGQSIPNNINHNSNNNNSNNNNNNDNNGSSSMNNHNNNLYSMNSNNSFNFGGPFFDMEHFPITNPPIYEPDVLAGVVRRRVSISNGQIGQLRDSHIHSDDSTTEDQIFTPNHQPQPSMNQILPQAPPPLLPNQSTMPHHQLQQQQQQQQPFGFPQQQQMINQNQPILQFPPQQYTARQVIPNNTTSNNNNNNPNSTSAILNGNTTTTTTTNTNTTTNNTNNNDNTNTNNSNTVVTLLNSQRPIPPQTPTSATTQLSARDTNTFLVSHHQYPSPQLLMTTGTPPGAPIPGTAAWKRARLLERNRVAASKCRQKKKVAQQQLQEEANVATRECKLLRQRVEYLESTLGKVKDVMRNHMKSCNGSSLSIDILEDFLKLDEKDQVTKKA
ncbi:Cst6 protein [Saccharomycopsis crataegensis]|uniref:Cst6 protein n=1 Tax=Saccharomycopsis crataegensis TaxID=43959 RepID=A0AAV5QEH1_9ASCO|nr:Cst6 protein [Saccharomycopsis crataegensis]